MLGRQWRTGCTNDNKVALVGTSSNKQLEEGNTLARQSAQMYPGVNVL